MEVGTTRHPLGIEYENTTGVQCARTTKTGSAMVSQTEWCAPKTR